MTALLFLAGCASPAVATSVPPTLGPTAPSPEPVTPAPVVAAASFTPIPAAATPTVASPSSAGLDIKIVEPPFKPPSSWTYDPVTVTVQVGTKITWTNTGAVLHTVDADDGQAFLSGDLPPQAAFTFTATKAGTFPYHCHYHPWMKGTIIVQP